MACFALPFFVSKDSFTQALLSFFSAWGDISIKHTSSRPVAMPAGRKEVF